MVLHEFHLLTAEAAARLLKTIEEPPPSTTFVVLADFVPPDLVTIASRCVRIDFRSIPDDVMAARLAAEGVPAEATRRRSRQRGGDLSRARILAADPGARRPARGVRRAALAPRRHRPTVVVAVDELLALIDDAAAPLVARQAAEIAELDARAEQFGERGSGGARSRSATAASCAATAPTSCAAGSACWPAPTATCWSPGEAHRPEALIAAVTRIHDTLEAFEHNPNEPLMLQSLLWSLPAT